MQKSRCSIAFKNAEVVSLRGAKRRRHLWHREMRARERERERERVARVTSRFEEVENRRNARQKFNRTQKRARLLEEQARTDCRGRGSLSLSLSLSLRASFRREKIPRSAAVPESISGAPKERERRCACAKGLRRDGRGLVGWNVPRGETRASFPGESCRDASRRETALRMHRAMLTARGIRARGRSLIRAACPRFSMGAKEAECRAPGAPKSGTVITNSRSRGHRARV